MAVALEAVPEEPTSPILSYQVSPHHMMPSQTRRLTLPAKVISVPENDRGKSIRTVPSFCSLLLDQLVLSPSLGTCPIQQLPICQGIRSGHGPSVRKSTTLARAVYRTIWACFASPGKTHTHIRPLSFCIWQVLIHNLYKSFFDRRKLTHFESGYTRL